MAMGVLVDEHRRCGNSSLRLFLFGRMFDSDFVVHKHPTYRANTLFLLAFAPLLLERKANKIRKTLDPEKGQHKNIRTVFQSNDRHWKRIFAKALVRPFVIFAYEPIVQLLGIYMAFVYGVIYCEHNLFAYYAAISGDTFQCS